MKEIVKTSISKDHLEEADERKENVIDSHASLKDDDVPNEDVPINEEKKVNFEVMK